MTRAAGLLDVAESCEQFCRRQATVELDGQSFDAALGACRAGHWRTAWHPGVVCQPVVMLGVAACRRERLGRRVFDRNPMHAQQRMCVGVCTISTAVFTGLGRSSGAHIPRSKVQGSLQIEKTDPRNTEDYGYSTDRKASSCSRTSMA